LRCRLFAEEAVVGERCRNLATNERFDIAVGVADEITRTLELDDQTLAIAEVVESERAGRAGDALDEIVAGGHRHATGRPRRGYVWIPGWQCRCASLRSRRAASRATQHCPAPPRRTR